MEDSPPRSEDDEQPGSKNQLSIVQEGKTVPEPLHWCCSTPSISENTSPGDQSQPGRKSGLLIPTFFSFMIELCGRKQTSLGSEEWVADQLWVSYGSTCYFCLFIIHRYIFDSHSVLSSLWGAEFSRLRVPWVYKKIYRLLKKIIKVRKWYGSTLYCHLGNPCLFFTP